MLNTYVYVYYDPTTKQPFYVGKGTGYRDRSHLKPSSWKEPRKTVNPFFYYKIKSLMEKGMPPIIKREYENITEELAYQIENDLINQYGRRFVDGGILFNISDFKGGSYKGQKHKWSDDRREKFQEFHKKNRVQIDENELYDLFINQNWTRKKIAQYYGVSDPLIKVRLKEYGIKKPRKLADRNKIRKVVKEQICLHCNEKFIVSSSWAINEKYNRKYCSYECSYSARKGVPLGKRKK